MQIAEPTTLITDYLLGAYTLFIGLRILSMGRAHRYPAQCYWGLSMLVAGTGTLVGGTMHGFRPMLPHDLVEILWRVTLSSAAVAAYIMVLAASTDRLPARITCLVAGVVTLKLLGVLFAIFEFVNFIVAILDYGSSMLFVLAIYAWSLRQPGRQGAGYIVAGVLISYLAAGVQMTGIVFNEYFNYNDLYHLIQIGAMYAFYKGIRTLSPMQPAGNAPACLVFRFLNAVLNLRPQRSGVLE